MPSIYAVIGANFGDEGKGLVTDFLADGPKSLVIRYNGGAQAGHTVVTPEGKRHVFHHFGSGSFRGAHTFLSQHFLVNPLAFMDELDELKAKGVTPTVFVDPRARVVTPWDMMMNQAIETKRGNGRHGSCGHGIHETVLRNKTFPLKVSDLIDGTFSKKLLDIKNVYVPDRAKELGLDLGGDLPYWNNVGVERHFFEDIEFFRKLVLPMFWSPAMAQQYLDLVFEGAQGLRLDEESSYFPNVTCSKTGMHNISSMVREANLSDEVVYPHYVTRAYVTRHGRGVLPHQYPGIPYPMIVDPTNQPNPWQESIRFAYHDVGEFAMFVKGDIDSAGVRIDPVLVVTCTDQVGYTHRWYEHGVLKEGSFRDLARQLTYPSDLRGTWFSNGPTRTNLDQLA